MLFDKSGQRKRKRTSDGVCDLSEPLAQDAAPGQADRGELAIICACVADVGLLHARGIAAEYYNINNIIIKG